MSVESNLTPPPGHAATKINPHLKPNSFIHSKSEHAETASSITSSDDESRSQSTHLELKPSYKPTHKKGEPVRKEAEEEIERNKNISRNFRHFLFLFKNMQLARPSPKATPSLTPLQIQLLNLRSGKPLSFEALKMLLVHYTRLGVDVHKIDSKAMEKPEEHSIPRSQLR